MESRTPWMIHEPELDMFVGPRDFDACFDTVEQFFDLKPTDTEVRFVATHKPGPKHYEVRSATVFDWSIYFVLATGQLYRICLLGALANWAATQYRAGFRYVYMEAR